MRLLSVDDDQTARLLTRQLLGKRGYVVDVASNGPEALRMVRANDYDLVILDYAMPEMNGVELFQRIRDLCPDMLGVFLTAHTRVDTVFPAVDAGVSRILSKPIDGLELVATVEELIGAPTG